MTPRYCLDTSWISNPLVEMPPDVHTTLWERIGALIDGGAFCWNTEIWQEIDGSIPGETGDSLKRRHRSGGCYEIGQSHWDWQAYLAHVDAMNDKYRQYISEYNGDRKSTVGVTDVSIVCLAKTLGLPVASMEKPTSHSSPKRIRIPGLCNREGIPHYDLNELLRKEKITV